MFRYSHAFSVNDFSGFPSYSIYICGTAREDNNSGMKNAKSSKSWEDVITDEDKLIYSVAGYGQREGLGHGSRPAVLVVDVTMNFVGDRPEPILESIHRFPNSCGERGWKAMRNIEKLLVVARRARIPVIYSTTDITRNGNPDPSWAMKKLGRETAQGNAIPRLISPHPRDTIVIKRKPSLFFGTPLISQLNTMHIDSLLVTGGTTSGCVRATVIDAFSYGYRVAVIGECVFDRGLISHKVNLFDMDQKYADVISLREALDYLKSLSRQDRRLRQARVSREFGRLSQS